MNKITRCVVLAASLLALLPSFGCQSANEEHSERQRQHRELQQPKPHPKPQTQTQTQTQAQSDAAPEKPAAAESEAANPKSAPRILVTNDDGIDAPGLRALVQELAKLGEVVVVAPDGNRSCASHSVTPTGVMKVEKHAVPGARQAFRISGQPADAVTFAIVRLGRQRPFDIVVSGINKGSNAGLVAHYSGTVGAAMEAVYLGVPAVAVSQDDKQTDHGIAARFTRELVRKLLLNGIPKGIGYNVNVPSGPKSHLRGVAVARMGGSFFRVLDFVPDLKLGANMYRSRQERFKQGPAGSDTRAYFENKITVVPVRLEWTDDKELRRLLSWKLRVQ